MGQDLVKKEQDDIFDHSPVKKKMVDAMADMATSERDSINYQHSILCQVGLPRSKVDGNSFERKTANAILSVEAGKLFDGENLVQQVVPYGPKARLALGYIHTMAIKSRSPIIPVGDSARHFLQLLGLKSDDGRTYRLVRQQLMALSACKFVLGYFSPMGGAPTTLNTMPVKRFELWGSDTTGGQRPLWPGEIELREDYFNDLIVHGVPYDPRAYAALSHSALAQDIYLMLCYRLHQLGPEGMKVTWKQWLEQFGQEYHGKDAVKNFKSRFLPALRDALHVYQEAKVEIVHGGLLLKQSRPPIAKL